MTLLSQILSIFAFLQCSQAAAPFRAYAQQAQPPNLEQLTCSPDYPDLPRPLLPSANCLFALRNFTARHQNPPNGQIIFTTNATKAEDPEFSKQYSFTPKGIQPSGQPAEPECALSYTVYYGVAPVGDQPDAVVPLRDLKIATNYVIGNCTGGNGPGRGGFVRLITSVAREIVIQVFGVT